MFLVRPVTVKETVQNVGGATVGPYRKPRGGRMKWRVVLEVISARGVRPPTFWTVSCYKKVPFVRWGRGREGVEAHGCPEPPWRGWGGGRLAPIAFRDVPVFRPRTSIRDLAQPWTG